MTVVRRCVLVKKARTLILSFFFPPCTDGASTLMHNLCNYLPREDYAVITTQEEFGLHCWNDLGIHDKEYALDCDAIRLPVKMNRIQDRIRFFLLAVLEGVLFNAKEGIGCVLAVYPDEFDIFGAYFLRYLTGRPIVIYMHDLFSETRVGTKGYRLWKFVEEKIFASASVILVTNEIFKKHYEKRGIKNVRVLPSCVDLSSSVPKVAFQEKETTSHEKLRIVYTGSIYAANEDAIISFINASKKVNDVEVVFCTPYSRDYLEGINVGFLPKKECQRLQEDADVLFLPLSFRSSYSDEIKCAFPCKSLEYLAAGKPVLAVVPEKSYMEELIEGNGVGIVVTELSERKIADAIELLKDEKKRKCFSKNARETARKFDSAIQTKRLLSIIEYAASDKLKERKVKNRHHRN